MASIEFITKRIEGKKAELKKLQAKAERIADAAATGWTVNPYYYNANDAKWTAKHIAEAEKQLAEYEAKLAVEQEKANSRDVAIIIEFLEAWKRNVREYYADRFAKYPKAHEKYTKEHDRLSNEMAKYNWRSDEYIELRNERKELNKNFEQAWKGVREYIIQKVHFTDDYNSHYFSYSFDTDRFEKDIKQDAEDKYDEIIDRTNSIVGQITDAGALCIGLKGDLNGVVIGTKGKAKVTTIGAGGYNIQCYHFRTLIREAK